MPIDKPRTVIIVAMLTSNATSRKRAQDEDNEALPPATKNAKMSLGATSTTFLTLPRELRQLILRQTYKHDITLHDSFQAFMDRVTEEKGFYYEHKVNGCVLGFNDWVHSIKDIHQHIAEDMEYIEEKWNKDYLAVNANLILEWDACFA